MSAAPVAAYAQDADQLGKEGRAAFECAVLAAEGTSASKPKATGLARAGHDKTTQAMAVVLPMLQESMRDSPLGAYMADQDTDFMVALTFAESMRKVTEFLDTEAPFDGGGSYEAVRMARTFAADTEFDRRNCDFLVR